MIVVADRVVTGEPDRPLLVPGWVEVADGVVGALGTGPPPAPGPVVCGATVVPGFVDVHSHGGGGASYAKGSPLVVRAAALTHLRRGTTSTLASLVSAHPDLLARQVARLADRVDEGLVAGVHLEGPWLAPARRGAHDPAALRLPDPAEVEALLTAGRGTVRMVTVAPELPGAIETVRRVVGAGAVAAIGHTDATYEQTRAAIDAGARVATHLFNAMRPVHHREPGPVVALLEDERVTIELIADGVHLHPAVHREVLARVGAGRVALVTDATAAAGMPDGPYELGGLAVDVRSGVARLAGGDVIAGGTTTGDRLYVAALTAALGLTGADRAADRAGELDPAVVSAVQQTSVVPARALGLPAAGLAPGRPADLVVLDEQHAPTAVMRAGEWVGG